MPPPWSTYTTERFVRASGPGGQNVNKVATAVQLWFDVGAAPLAPEVKARLRTLAGRRLSADDILLIEAREFRTQAQNREAARARLEELIQRAHMRPRARRKSRPPAVVREKRLEGKARRSAIKRRRAPPRGEE